MAKPFNKFHFSAEDDDYIRKNLSKLGSRKVGAHFGVSKTLILRRAKELNLQKVLNKNSQKSQIQIGDKLSLGRKISPEHYEKMKATMFKKGNKPHNTKEVGYRRFDKDGYIEIKTESGFVFEHRLIWEHNYGKIPEGHVIIFKDTDKTNLELGNLECISLEENGIRNHFAPNYPREIQRLEYTRVKLERKIKQINGKK